MCMIKARIRWCSCRVENILTLGKLLSLWFCFLLHSFCFLYLKPLIGERVKRARHSQVCSIENRGYIYYYVYIVHANFVLITHTEGGAEF